ncbi:MAG TPA: hypothetical protein DEB32_11695 [Stenotrophomonas sp.]|jgi:hypothetical protein|uniref:Uncharacterized protein n=1 Tax=Stenotrophomonas maltophilia TaxID=40324 RepID=A0A4S2CVW3_STEMA|nr:MULTISPECIES: hypothetical protein [Stenotrophomonas]QIO87345.1 hypothetical protein G9274_001030 [Stenotrophomonas rhizophila]TGY32686.1 hypothetical protein E5352_14735 [Stenotrophomonas maltophilia]HBS63357.1 hypothetical protein [Stenotrophomonas sp.]
MQIDLRAIPTAGWDATGVPEFPCCPDPQLGSLAKAGRDAADIDALIAFLQDSFTSTLYAFGHILRAHLPPRDLRLQAAAIGTLHQGGTDAIVHHGNLIVDGDLQPPSLLLVTGNLTVNGVLRDTGNVAVLGDLHCRHVGSEAWFIVGGDCVAEGFVYGSCNDTVFEVLGTLRARAVVTDDHAMYAEDGMIVTHAPTLPGVNWEVQVFDLWDPVHRQELLAAVGTDIHAVVPVKAFEDEDLG